MSFTDTIPAQVEAAEYLESASKKIKGSFRICGHSKGGNLAIYAAAFCGKGTRNRIKGIYANDAPGFKKNVISSEGYGAVKNIIRSYVPQSSVVGMLFEHGTSNTVIKSSTYGLLQHDLYSWEVTHNDLVLVKEVSKRSRFVDKTLKDWIDSMDYKHREQFTEGLFEILSASQTDSVTELADDWFNAAGRMLQSLGSLDESTKKVLGQTITALFRTARNNLDSLLKPNKQK
jgi:hypothetical protein